MNNYSRHRVRETDPGCLVPGVRTIGAEQDILENESLIWEPAVGVGFIGYSKRTD